MEHNRPMWMLAGAMVCGLSSAAMAQGPSTADVAAEVQALRAEVAQLRANKNENWLNERRAEEVKALVREVLSDADTRASLADSGMTAGHNGKNFFLTSADNTFLMNVSGQMQMRYIANFRNASSPDSDKGAAGMGSPADDARSGFQIRRGKLKFDGHIASPKIGYEMQLAADRNTTAFGLEIARVSYNLGEYFGGKLEVNAGRFKAPFLREELVSSARQTAVERSSVNEVFTTGHVEGASLGWSTNTAKVVVMINDGTNSGEIGGAANDFHNDNTDLALTARGDLALAGDLKQTADFAAWEGEPLGVFLGAAVHYELGESGTRAAAPGMSNCTSFVQWTIDGSVEYQGFNIYGAFVGAHLDANDDVSAANVLGSNKSSYGALVQAGYMVIPDKLEPFVRYEWIELDAGPGANTNTSLVTFGANYYLKKHSAKFTMDVVVGLDPLSTRSNATTSASSLSYGAAPRSSGGVSSGQGLLRDGTSRDSQVALRFQFQLLF